MKWTVGGKLALGFGIVVAFTVALALAEWLEAGRLRDRVEGLYRNGVVLTESLGQAGNHLQRMRGRTFYHIASSDPVELRRIEDQLATEGRRFLEQFARAERALLESDNRRQQLEGVKQRFHEYTRSRDEVVIPPSRRGENAEALDIAIQEVGPLFDQTVELLDDLVADQLVRSKEVYADVDQSLSAANRMSLLGSLAAALTAAGVASWLARSISFRVSNLANVARALGEGNLRQRASVEQTDEITELAVAFNRTADELERHIQEQKSIADQQRREREELVTQVERYGAFLERVAAGELTAHISVEGHAEFAKLGQNLNAMSGGLRTMTLRVHETVAALSSASAEILATTQEHSVSANESASAVAETVATVEEVSQAAQQMTASAQGVQAAAQRTQEVAESGREAVDRSTTAMSAVRTQVTAIAERILSLSEHAQAVGHIITTVNELSEQSNLLALNASIEAARAGAEGRAFGIVAQEIRGLADQSRQATAQVRNILETIQKSTSAAVLTTEEGQKTVDAAETTVGEAGQTIERLAQTLEETSVAADRILAAAEQQAQGVRQISEAMRSIDSAARQSVEGTRHVETAASDLNKLSGSLQQAVAQYRI